tara:strand:- start:7205 stop:7939 length:735 start_codon:yes stop_codon:yes gene_type:complete
MNCPECKTETPLESQVCPECGYRFSEFPHTTPLTVSPVPTLWADHPAIRSFKGTFFLSIFLLFSGPILYGLSHVTPFSEWSEKVQTYTDPVWSTIANILHLTERVPHISLIAILSTALFIPACVFFVKSWVWSRQIRYLLTPEYLIIIHGFLARTKKQLPTTTIKELTLEQSFLDRLIGIGTIDIYTSNPSFGHISIQGISSPTETFDVFYQVWQDNTPNENSRRLEDDVVKFSENPTQQYEES